MTSCAFAELATSRLVRRVQSQPAPENLAVIDWMTAGHNLMTRRFAQWQRITYWLPQRFSDRTTGM